MTKLQNNKDKDAMNNAKRILEEKGKRKSGIKYERESESKARRWGKSEEEAKVEERKEEEPIINTIPYDEKEKDESEKAGESYGVSATMQQNNT